MARTITPMVSMTGYAADLRPGDFVDSMGGTGSDGRDYKRYRVSTTVKAIRPVIERSGLTSRNKIGVDFLNAKCDTVLWTAYPVTFRRPASAS